MSHTSPCSLLLERSCTSKPYPVFKGHQLMPKLVSCCNNRLACNNIRTRPNLRHQYLVEIALIAVSPPKSTPCAKSAHLLSFPLYAPPLDTIQSVNHSAGFMHFVEKARKNWHRCLQYLRRGIQWTLHIHERPHNLSININQCFCHCFIIC